MEHAPVPEGPEAILAVWDALCAGQPPPPLAGDGGGAAATALAEKHAKSRLAVAADIFNRDTRKGFQYLQVLPPSLCLRPIGILNNGIDSPSFLSKKSSA